MSLAKPAALFMCVAHVGHMALAAASASAQEGAAQPVQTAPAASKAAPAGKAPEAKKAATTAPSAAHQKREAHAGAKVEKKAGASAHRDAKKAPAARKAAHKPAATGEKPKAEAPATKPVAPVDGASKSEPAAAAKPASSVAPVEASKGAPQPVSKAWLDDNEKRLRGAVAGSKFAVERRGDLLMVVAPADAAFNRDRPNMLLPASLGPLSKVAKQLEGDAQSAVLVLGHGDGNSEADRKLSQERAQAVASIFRMSGLKGDRLMLRGMGADKPLASNDNAKGRAQNRRVEIILTQRGSLPALLAQNSH